jgi:hypothetical protein
MDYFLIAREGWGIPVQRFTLLLTSRWPTATIQSVEIPGGNRSVEFRLPMQESTIHGALNLEGSAVIFYGAIRDCADFALWYQATVPEGQPFLLCDEGYNQSIVLNEQTTVEEICRVIEGEPPP